MLRCWIFFIVVTSAGTSKTSRNTSRYVSRMIGNEPNREATCSRSYARLRCCQSGVRRSGRRRGRSSARGGFAELVREHGDLAELSRAELCDFVGVGNNQLRARRGAGVAGAEDVAV